MNDIIEIHDSHGEVWNIRQRDVVATSVTNRVLRVYVKGIALPVSVEIHESKVDKASTLASDIVAGRLVGKTLISEPSF